MLFILSRIVVPVTSQVLITFFISYMKYYLKIILLRQNILEIVSTCATKYTASLILSTIMIDLLAKCYVLISCLVKYISEPTVYYNTITMILIIWLCYVYKGQNMVHILYCTQNTRCNTIYVLVFLIVYIFCVIYFMQRNIHVITNCCTCI